MSTNAPNARKPAGIGPDMGLTVLVNLSRNDYYYPLKSFVGATVLVFDPLEFADSSTGSVREVPVDPFQEVRIAVGLKTKIAVDDVQRYSISKRKIQISLEVNLIFYNFRRVHVCFRSPRGIQRKLRLWRLLSQVQVEERDCVVQMQTL